MPTDIHIRQAVFADIPVLRELINASVRGLQVHDYTAAQIESALKTIFGVDSQLIADGTYFVAEANSGEAAIVPAKTFSPNIVIVGCGGWSQRQTLYGGDQWAGRQNKLLDPLYDAAKIRSFFIHPAWARRRIHPAWARRRIGSMILETCEVAAQAAGFTRFEMGATLTGVKLFQTRGYVALERLEVPLEDSASLPVIRMEKRVPTTIREFGTMV